MKAALPLFKFLAAAEGRGEATALVTITHITGGSSRAPGTHLAVTEKGEWIGSVSGGCIEAAIVAEAVRVIANGISETIRFGAGSRFIDIRLPCGGGLDLLFTPNLDPQELISICRMLGTRCSVALRLDDKGGMSAAPALIGMTDGWVGDEFVVCHHPDLRLVIFGQGEEVHALARLGTAHGAIVEIHTPNIRLLDQCRQQGIASYILKSQTDRKFIRVDEFTACIFLFHDHDWEAPLMAQVLRAGAFYVGAMGSCATQRRRLRLLREAGVPNIEVDRVIGPIGFIPSSRDPETLALSVLGEIVARQHGVMPSISKI